MAERGWVRKIFKAIGLTSSAASLGLIAHVYVTEVLPLLDTATEANETITVDLVDIPASPPLAYDVVEPQIITEQPPSVAEPQNLADFSENFPTRHMYYVDLALRMESATGVDAYTILAKLAMETRLDQDFVARANHGVRGARGDWQLELGNLVTSIREHGRDIDFSTFIEAGDPLLHAIYHHGDHIYLQQLPFFADLDTDDPLRLALENNDRLYLEDADYTHLAPLIQNMINDWVNHWRVRDSYLVDYIVQQVESGQFSNDMDRLIYAIPENSNVAGLFALAHTPTLFPEAMAANFTGSWQDDLEARNQAAFNLYAYHNMGRRGGALQTLIAATPEWQRVTLGDTEALSDILTIIENSYGLRIVSTATLQRNGLRNPAVFQMGDDTFYGCLHYNITMEIDSHIGDFLPPATHDWTRWHDVYCGRNAATALAPQVSIRPLMRPIPLEEIAQDGVGSTPSPG